MAMPRQLEASYLTGKVATRIRWGMPGDWTRCVRQGRKHGIPGGVARGMCQTLHKKATGVYTGDKRNLRGAKVKR